MFILETLLDYIGGLGPVQGGTRLWDLPLDSIVDLMLVRSYIAMFIYYAYAYTLLGMPSLSFLSLSPAALRV
jgi:membrane-anchored protein YejM (alkaline phosphatase superfamily)